MNIKQLLSQRFAAALDACGATDAPPVVNTSKRPEFGDYQANGVMGAAKRLGRAPRELAAEVVATVQVDDIAESLEIAGPGFINIRLRPDFIASCCARDNDIVTTVANSQRVVVDYSSPNLAKEMHVGHIRSTIIGDALGRMLEALGHTVIRQNHVGDWGTQFGMLITHLADVQAAPDNNGGSATEFELDDLEGFYRASKQRYDAEPQFAQRAREAVVGLQSGDAKARVLWQRFIDLSLAHCDVLYARLGVKLTRADVQAESAYNSMLEGVVNRLREQNLLQMSEGAACVFLDEFKNKQGDPLPIIVQKTDGGYLYATTDLAAIDYRTNQLHADRVLYLVDVRQSLHFKQIFTLARLAGFANADIRLEHLPFGTMLGADGKPFKTRDGGVVKLASLLDAAEAQAIKLLEARAERSDLSATERQVVAKAVGIGAVKYADLSKNRTTDYLFDLEQMISFEGDTAPYLQYAHTRITSLFARGEITADEIAATPTLIEAEERDLGLALIRLQEVLEQAVSEGYPHYLCTYLYDLATRYSRFYESCPVLSSEGEMRASRLALCERCEQTLSLGLEMLGIETVARM
jgi:arginyl-tRNA synthetase